MSDHPPHDLDHDNVYDGLLGVSSGSTDAGWAFGTGFADPLEGVDMTVPAGVEAPALARLCLALGDDALITGHRLSEWVSNAPDLEVDIALANLALDLIGQARLLLARAAAADPGLVPSLPAGSPVPVEDALAYFRDADEFRATAFAALPRGDFADAVVRVLLGSVARILRMEDLRHHADPVLAAIAAKSITELTYHRSWSAQWFTTLALGTEESRRRLVAALDAVWGPYVEARVDLDDGVLDELFAHAGVERPSPGSGATDAPDHLADLLAEMQSLARAHPEAVW